MFGPSMYQCLGCRGQTRNIKKFVFEAIVVAPAVSVGEREEKALKGYSLFLAIPPLMKAFLGYFLSPTYGKLH